MIFSFVGLPGTGKTLSMIHHVSDKIRKGFRVYTNVPFQVRLSKNQPIYLENQDLLAQFLLEKNATFLIDEGQIVFRAYSFGKIDYSFLDKFAQGRKLQLDLYYTAQRFKHVLARLRDLTNIVIECQKVVSIGHKFAIFRNIQYNPDIYDREHLFGTDIEKKYILKRNFLLPWHVKETYKQYDTNFIINSFSAEDFSIAKKRNDRYNTSQNTIRSSNSIQPQAFEYSNIEKKSGKRPNFF